MKKPKVIALTGYGINCDDETKFAFEKAGASVDIIHVNDLINKQKKLSNYQILAFPGGFSYGDDTGSGNALANRIKNHLWDEVLDFVSDDKLAIGICNGFQIMVNLGLIPAIHENYGARRVALLHNDSARYIDRWVDLKFYQDDTPWIHNIRNMSLPIAHGEGKFYADKLTLELINEKMMIAARYYDGEISKSQHLPANPNGALENIAGITDGSGRLLGMMPHPERAISFTQLPNWTLLKEQYQRAGKKVPTEGPGIKIFRNGVNYFK